jgi:hypothetical protein
VSRYPDDSPFAASVTYLPVDRGRPGGLRRGRWYVFTGFPRHSRGTRRFEVTDAMRATPKPTEREETRE